MGENIPPEDDIKAILLGQYNASRNRFEKSLKLSVGADLKTKKARSFVSHEVAEKFRLQRKVGHDSLTGLPKKEIFLERMREGLSLLARGKAEQATLLALDMDGFKKVNDTYGHGQGDVVIAALGRMLKKSTRPYDIVARTGGDEFAVFQLNGPKDLGSIVSLRIQESLYAQADTLRGFDLIHPSVGIVQIEPSAAAVPAHMWLERADVALYHAKSMIGPGKVAVWDSTMMMPRRTSSR